MTARSVAVYGSSRPSTPSAFTDSAQELGLALAGAGHVLVYGGGRYGAMAAAARGAKEGGARVVSVIHKLWSVDDEERVKAGEIDEVFVVEGDDLRERKAGLLNRADCVISMPGGTGTFDELCEGTSG